MKEGGFTSNLVIIIWLQRFVKVKTCFVKLYIEFAFELFNGYL